MNKKIARKVLAHIQEGKKLTAKQSENDTDWLDIGNGLEISKQVHNGKTYAEIKELLNKREKVADYALLQKLRNKNMDERFKDFWVFVPNPDKITENNNYIARFSASSDRAFLDCDRSPSISYASLGVFIVRKKIRGKKSKSRYSVKHKSKWKKHGGF